MLSPQSSSSAALVNRRAPDYQARMAGTQKHRIFAVVLLACSPWFSRVASAQAAPANASQLSFAWAAPEGCASEQNVRARVDRILGTHATPHENVDARVRVVTDGSTYHAEIELNSAGQSSSRRVDDSSCDALADAVALIVALAVDPEAVAPKKEAPPPPAPVSPPSPSPSPPATIANRAENEPVQRHPIFVGGSILLDTATLAALAVGAEFVVGYNPKHVALEISGSWLAAQDARLAAGSTEGASEHALGIGARGCWEIFDSAFTIGPCGGAELTGIFADGFGSTQTSEASAALFRALLGGRAKLQFSRFALRLGAEAAIPFSRPSFVIDNAGTIQHISPATFRTTFGAELHF